jgi:hypothetical protein
MYIITSSNDGREVPLGAFSRDNDTDAITYFDDKMDESIEKAKMIFFGQPNDIALWNTYSEPVCVYRRNP